MNHGFSWNVFLPLIESKRMSARKKAEHWLNQNIDKEFKAQIQLLLDRDDESLEDAFYKDLEFGTGGMRGIMGVGSNRVNKYTLGMATQGLSNYLKKAFPETHLRIAIAYDCRNNSAAFAQWVADIFTANDVEVFLFKSLRPTPQLSYAVRELNCQSGIVITASHNPPEYNGYKVYWNDGAQIVGPHDKGIIDEVKAVKSLEHIKFNANLDFLHLLDDEMDERFLKASSNQRVSKENHPLRIAYTSLHGTSITLMPQLLKKAGYNDVHIVEEQREPNGNFPTVKSPNPEEREALDLALKLADRVDADMVVGTDPDSDRLGVAVRNLDGKMILLNGNQCGVLITDYLLSNAKLNGNEFIAYTIVSSEMFKDVATGYSVDAEVCLTGFKHIAALIRNNEGVRKFIGGGEESYGYMVGDFVRDKDALTSTLIFCDLAAKAKADGSSVYQVLCELYEKHGFYFEHLLSITKKGKHGADEISAMMDNFRAHPPKSLGGEKIVRIDDIYTSTRLNMINGNLETIHLPKSNVLQFYTENGSKISARPSGTEPKIKFYFSIKAPWNKSKQLTEQENELMLVVEKMIKDLNQG
jgi:phosphoglucomutase